MSHKLTITVVALFVIVLVGLAGAGFYFSRDTDITPGEALRDFLPFGQGSDEVSRTRPDTEIDVLDEPGETPSGVSTGSGVVPGADAARALRKLTTVAVSGAKAFSGQNGTRVRFLERATGHVFELELASGFVTRLTNTTIPAVRDAAWSGDGASLVLRYLDENNVVRSFAASIAGSGGTSTPAGTVGSLEGEFLPNDIFSIVSSPAGTRIFYLHTLGNSAIGITSSFENGEKEQVFDSPFISWRASWPADTTLALATKASADAEGFLYFLDREISGLERVLGDIPGLTALVSPSARDVLYSETRNGTVQAFVHNIESRGRFDFPITTLPEKCVWSSLDQEVVYCGAPDEMSTGTYPDDWYQGVLSFSDSIWKVNVGTGALELLSVPKDVAREEIDIINPFLNDKETHLFFTNKKDGTLWSYMF